MTMRLARAGIVVGSVLAGTLLILVALNTTRWIGTTFPGFFVMANRVIPSVSLPGWLELDSARLFQSQVVAVDDVAITTSAAIYERVRRLPPGTPIRYRIRARSGVTTTEVVPSRRFSGADYLLLFGGYLLCGATFLAVGMAVFWLRPCTAASLGLLSAGLSLGVFALTGADLYGPHWFFRLHVFTEAMIPASCIHLALVFPAGRIERHYRSALAALYLPFLSLAAAYEVVVYIPPAYSAIHLLASASHGVSGITIVGLITYELLTTESAEVRHRIGVVGVGALAAFIVPIVLMGASGLLSGGVPVNGAGLTAFIFPVSLGYAILKRDLLGTEAFQAQG